MFHFFNRVQFYLDQETKNSYKRWTLYYLVLSISYGTSFSTFSPSQSQYLPYWIMAGTLILVAIGFHIRSFLLTYEFQKERYARENFTFPLYSPEDIMFMLKAHSMLPFNFSFRIDDSEDPIHRIMDTAQEHLLAKTLTKYGAVLEPKSFTELKEVLDGCIKTLENDQNDPPTSRWLEGQFEKMQEILAVEVKTESNWLFNTLIERVKYHPHSSEALFTCKLLRNVILSHEFGML